MAKCPKSVRVVGVQVLARTNCQKWHLEVRVKNGKGVDKFRFFEGISSCKSERAKKAAVLKLYTALKRLVATGWVPTKRNPDEPTINSEWPLRLTDCLKYVLELKQIELRATSHRQYRITAELLTNWLVATGRALYKPNEFGRKEAYQFADFIQRKVSNTSRNNVIRNARAIFSFMYQREIISTNPFAHIKRAPETITTHKPYAPGTIAIVKNHLQQHDKGLWVFIQCMYYTFLRPNELRQLRCNHIDIERCIIQVPASISKTRNNSYVAIPPQLASELKVHIEGAQNDHFVFSNDLLPGGHQLHMDTVRLRFHKHLVKLNLHKQGHTLYSWKHTGVIQLVSSGANIREVQMQLRHSSLDMVARYLRTLGVTSQSAAILNFPSI